RKRLNAGETAKPMGHALLGGERRSKGLRPSILAIAGDGDKLCALMENLLGTLNRTYLSVPAPGGGSDAGSPPPPASPTPLARPARPGRGRRARPRRWSAGPERRRRGRACPWRRGRPAAAADRCARGRG